MLKKAHAFGEKVELLDSTIGDYLDSIAKSNPSHPALIMPHQDIRWNYGEFTAEVERLAKGFLALGINKGDRVGIWSPNRYEWVLTQFATAKIGAILVCINPAYRLYELEYALNKVQCRAIVAAEQFKSSNYLRMLNELAPELASCAQGRLHAKNLPHLEIVIRMGGEPSPGMLNFSDVCTLGDGVQTDAVNKIADTINPDDVINIQFTSGTTGSPKGAALTHRGLLNNAYLTGRSMRLTAQDRLCIPVPLYHCFGMVMGTLCCVVHGATMVLPVEAFEPDAVLRTVEQERCTALHGVPTMFLAELDCPTLEGTDVSSLRTGIIAGATCPEQLMRRLIGEMGLKELVIAYGQTECSPVNHATSINDSFEHRTTTVGRPHYNWEIKIVREDGSICDVDEPGEVCARGYGVMAEYWNDPSQTASAIDAEGFLHSGDIGQMSGDGFVQITGRIKDMIIRGGENIYPREVEEFLCTHPGIAEAQVFGLPDGRYGEQVAAWIKVREGSDLTEADVQEFCNGRIAHFKVPKYVKFVDDYPMTVTGKMQKFVMRAEYAVELQLDLHQ